MFGRRLADEFRSVLEDAIPGWRRHSAFPKTIEVITSNPDNVHPFELLPLFDFDSPPPIESEADVESFARRFLGFSTILKRELLTGTDPDRDVLRVSGPLPLFFFHFASLAGANAEFEFFREQQERGRVHLGGPWPTNDVRGRDFLDSLFSWVNIGRGTIISGDTILTFPHQVHHFACHSNTEHRHDHAHCFMLQSADGTTHKAHLEDLGRRIIQVRERPGWGPLVFLNACASGSGMHWSGAGSFASFFLRENRNRGFIGTEAEVPDEVAAIFSRAFYSRLLAGDSVGESMLAARWELLTHHHSVLGLLYNLYANPDMRVELAS
jgi:hypothetical protein